MLSTFSLRSKLITLVLAVTASAIMLVAASAFFIIVRSVDDRVASAQELNLRVAATTIQAAMPELEASYGRDGNIQALRAPGIPDFASHDLIDSVARQTGETATVFVWDPAERDFFRRTTTIQRADGTRAVGTPLGAGVVYDAMMRRDGYRGQATILGIDYFTVYQPILSTSGEPIGILYVGVKKAEVLAVRNNLAILIGTVSLMALLVIAVAAWFVTSRLLTPLDKVTQAVDELASGSRNMEIDFAQRQDEIGRIGCALTRLDTELASADAVRQDEAEAKATEIARAQRLAEEVGQFERIAEDALGSFKSVTANVLDQINRTRDTASDGRERSQSMRDAARSASAEVESMAASAEELNASISEVRNAASRVAELSEGAAERTTSSQAIMSEMSGALADMTEIISGINGVAEQTNLLALNATIEAARAGEAGKGFAVVASEVKQLAEQTTKLTETIAERIAGFETRVDQASQGADAIVDEISQITDASMQTAGAIEQQIAAVAEISRSAQAAARSTQTVDADSEAVSGGAEATLQASAEVAELSQELNTRSGELSDRIGNFIKAVQAA